MDSNNGNIYESNNSDISTGIIDPQNAPQKKNIHNDNSKKDGMVIENDFQDKKKDKTDPGQNDITKDNNNSIHIKYLGESTSLKTKILNIEDILYLEVKDVIKIHEDDTQYIECFQCNKEIDIKIKDISKLNSRNISCIYCNSFSVYYTICPKCKNHQIIYGFICEGELIKCCKCSFEYLQTLCPVKNCIEVFYFPKPKGYNNCPSGILTTHKSNLIFQKITCYYCLRPIVYYTTKENNRDRYFESMKIECPYPDCSKAFNRIICPQCNEINYLEYGLYMMGNKIKCNYCGHGFSKILCVYCLKINLLEKNIFKYGEFECRYINCGKKSLLANCLHCQRLNYFEKDSEGKILTQLIPGQKIKCGYHKCREKFCVVNCPHCHELNHFPKGDFIFGKVYKCKNALCKKYYSILICANCWNYSRMSEEIEGKKYTCDKCNTLLSNFQCPHCNESIFDINSYLVFGQLIKCPKCNKEFSFFRCYDCRRLIYLKNESLIGKSITCDNCGKKSVNVLCVKCKSKISFSSRESDLDVDEKINCPNCQKNFLFGEKFENEALNKTYSKNLCYIKEIEGICKLGNSSVDENYLKRSEYIEYNNKEEKDINNNNISIFTFKKNMKRKKKNDLCIICNSENKCSIFFPCGHRCCCYKCAMYYFEIYKKCAKCSKECICVIPKIYDT